MASASDGKLLMSVKVDADEVPDAVPSGTPPTPSTELVYAFDFTPADVTYSSSTNEYYGGTIASRKSELAESSFKIFLVDGVSDAIVGASGELRNFRFYPDRNVTTKYIDTLGYVSIKRTFPVGDQMQADVTIAPYQASTNVS